MKRIYALILVLVSVSTALCQTSYDYDHNNWVYQLKNSNFSALSDSDFMLFRSFESISEVLNKRYYLKNREGKPTAKPIILHDKRVKDDELVVVQYAEAKPRAENAVGVKTIYINANIEPVHYINRKDEYNNECVSSTIIRHDIYNHNYDMFKTAYINMLSNNILNEKILKKYYENLIDLS